MSDIKRDIRILENYIHNAEKAMNRSEGGVIHAEEIQSATIESFNSESTKDQVFSQINGLRKTLGEGSQFGDGRPRYFKPSFLLEYLAPVIHAKIYLRMPGGKLQIYDIFTDTKQSTLDNPNPQPTHNYIKSFTYNLFGENSNQAQLELVDVDSSLIEALVLRFQTLMTMQGGGSDSNEGTVMIEVEYGWSVPESLEEKYNRSFGDAANVKFTKSSMFLLTKPVMKYNLDGSISCTLEMTADPTRVPPFIWWSPIEELGKYPIANIAMTNFLTTMIQIFKNNKNNPQKFINNLGKWIYIEFMNGSGDIADLYILLQSIADMLDLEITASSACPTNELTNLAKKLFENAETPEETRALRINETIEKAYEELIGKEINIGKILGTALNKQRSGKLNTKGTEETPDNDEKFIGQSKLRALALKPIYKENEINNKAVEYFHKSIFDEKIGSTFYESFSNKLRKTKDTDPVLFRKMEDFLGKVTPFLLEWDIHPLVAEFYFMEKFWDKVGEDNAHLGDESADSAELVYISMFELNDIMPVGIYDKIVNGDPVVFTRAQKEQWCKKVRNYNVTAGSSWFSIIENSIRTQKFHYTTEDTNQAQILSGTQEVEKDSEGAFKGQYSVPADIQCNTIITSPEGMAVNLEIMLNLLKYNKAIEPGDERIKKIRETINRARTETYVGKKWVLFLKDLMPNSQVFKQDPNRSDLLQAFSFRPNKSPNFMTDKESWNPGYPNVWDVNFPDVISFEPDFDFFNGLQAVTMAMKPLKMGEGIVDVVDKRVELLEKISQHRERLESASEAEAQQAELRELKDLLRDLKEIQNESGSNQQLPAYPVTFNMDFDNKVTNNGSLPEVLAAKKSTQQFRKRLMLEQLNITANMTVVGDPSFNYDDHGKYIFIKVIHNDGSLSVFTGIYHLQNCVQTISNGDFKTQFTLRNDGTTDPTIANLMSEGIYNTDRMVVAKD